MQKITLLFFTFYGLSLGLWAQNISGKILDEKKQPISSATVALLQAKDSALLEMQVTENDGTFTFSKMATNKYFLAVSALNFKESYGEVFEHNEMQNTQLQAFILKSNETTLKTVDIVAKKALIEVQADKTVFNVSGSINAINTNALELLRKSPGVMVDNNDNVILKGKSGTRIYIDGKPSPLDGKTLAEQLKMLQSSQIESIELISNPSAKYDAAGNAGIINIKLKKNLNLGTNGSVLMGYAIQRFSKYNSGFSLNHRTEKVALFANYNNNWGKNWSYVNFYREQNGLMFDQNSDFYEKDFNNSLKAGADFYVNSKNTIGIMANGTLNKGTFQADSKTEIATLPNKETQQWLFATNDVPKQRNNLNVNLNYRYADTTDRTFNVDLDYGIFRLRAESFQPNYYKSADLSTDLYEATFRNQTPTNIDLASAKADYEQKLWKGKLGIGGKFWYVKTDNTFNFYNVLNGTDYLDSTRTNQFSYTENVNALYLNYQRKLNEKWHFQLGVRGEQTNSRGLLTSFTAQNDKDVKRNYLNFFPSAAITFSPSQKHSFNLTYSRRIDRPNYQDLNPFENKIDELSYEKGNAFLRPQYANNLELTHTFLGFINTTLSYTHTRDFFTEITDTVENKRSYITKLNLGSQDNLGISMSLPIPVNKWWNIYTNFGGYYLKNKADFGQGKVINLGVTSFNIFMQHTFTLPKGFSIQASGAYNSPSVWGGTFRNRRFWFAEAGVQKSLFKNKANLSLNVSDLFYSMQWQGVSRYGGLYMVATGGWESRLLKLAFTYNFGNDKLKAARDRKTGADELKKRVK